jgi:phage baseplate assembly protein W
MAYLNPHFDIPFRFVPNVNASAAVVEQNSFEDIANCVEVIVRTPVGFRNDAPEFGFPQLELLEQPVVTKDVVELVQAQEPRASILITEQPDAIDILIDRITVEVS